MRGSMTAAFDEMRSADAAVRPAYAELSQWLSEISPDELGYRRRYGPRIWRSRARLTARMSKSRSLGGIFSRESGGG